MQVIVRDAKPDEGAPELIQMSDIDARHAVEADPERYSVEQRHPVAVNISTEDRLTFLERRVKALEAANKPEPEPETEPVKPEPLAGAGAAPEPEPIKEVVE